MSEKYYQNKRFTIILILASAFLTAGACDDSDSNTGDIETAKDSSPESTDKEADSESETFSEDTALDTEETGESSDTAPIDTGTQSEQTDATTDSGPAQTEDEPADTDTQLQTDTSTDTEAVQEEVTIVDVRTPTEYAEEHIDCAVNIPLSQIESRLDELPNKDATIIVYCRSGNRSAQAKQIFDDNGYTDVIDAGGIGGLRQDIEGGAYDDLNLPCTS